MTRTAGRGGVSAWPRHGRRVGKCLGHDTNFHSQPTESQLRYDPTEIIHVGAKRHRCVSGVDDVTILIPFLSSSLTQHMY